MIFIDEIDSVCRERSSREEEYSRRVKNELLKQIEGVGTHNHRLFLLCATNCPWELDTAFLRRLVADSALYFSEGLLNMYNTPQFIYNGTVPSCLE